MAKFRQCGYAFEHSIARDILGEQGLYFATQIGVSAMRFEKRVTFGGRVVKRSLIQRHGLLPAVVFHGSSGRKYS